MRTLVIFAAVAALGSGCHYYFESDDDGGDGDVDPGGDGDGGDGDGDVEVDGGISGACAEPLPDPLPDPPAVARDGNDRPRFASWENIDPAAAGDFYCNPMQEIACGSAAGNNNVCHVVDAATGDGYCTSGEAAIDCGGADQVMGYGDGSCWICAPVASHTALCAQGVAGVDCRIWPYPGNGTAGQICAVHEDCGAGLLCGAAAGDGYGVCMCPEDLGTNPAPPESCFNGL